MKNRVVKLVLVGLMVGCMGSSMNVFATEELDTKIESSQSNKTELEANMEQDDSTSVTFENFIENFNDIYTGIKGISKSEGLAKEDFVKREDNSITLEVDNGYKSVISFTVTDCMNCHRIALMSSR